MPNRLAVLLQVIVLGPVRVLQRGLRLIIGDFSWRPPFWLTGIGRLLGRIFQLAAVRITTWRQANPRVFWGTVSIMVLLAAAGYGGWMYYQSLPKPTRISISSTSPGPTKLEKDAKPDKVYLDFTGSAARLNQVGKPVSRGITINPAIPGEWVWENDARLCFTPKQDWAVDQDYTVTFAEELFPPQVLLEKYRHSFASAPFDLQLVSGEFYTDPQDPAVKKVLVTLKATHPIDEASLKNHVTLVKKTKRDYQWVLTDKTIPFTVTFDEIKGAGYIHSEILPVPLDEYYVTATIDKGVRSSRGGAGSPKELSTEVRIPGMYDCFQIASVEPTFVRNERFESEQVLVIETTAPARQEDLGRNLKVFVLPQDRPAHQNQPARKNYSWSNIDEIGTEVLNLSQALTLEPIPTEREFSTLHSFKYNADIGRFLFVRIQKGIKAYGDYLLAKTFEQIAKVPEMPMELTILHEGSILSLTGKRTISMLARDIEAVKFEIGRVLPNQINHLASQTYGNFQEPYFQSRWAFDQDNLTDRSEEVRVLQKSEKGKSQYLAFDFSPYLNGPDGNLRGLFFFKASSWDAEHQRTTGVEDTRFILITDLGLLVKTAVSGSTDAFVVSLRTGQPVEGAQVAVLGKNGLPVISEVANGLGHVRFPSLKDFEREKAPTVYVVTHAADFSFLPFGRHDRELNFSRFEIGGRHSSGRPDELRAYLFSDRGIYRPGDTVHVGMIVKSAAWGNHIAGVPLKTIVADPRGMIVHQQTIALSSTGFEELAFTPQENAPTGNYQVSLCVIDDQGYCKEQLGSSTVRVEEFLPDRLRIAARLSAMSDDGWVSPQGLKGLVSLHNLFGTPAADHRITGKIQLLPWSPAFRAYKEHQFFDPLKAENSYTEPVPEGRTDEQGNAELELDLKRFSEATYRLTFLAEGYEAAEGGRAVSAQASVLVSPNEYLIGYKPDGDLRYIHKESERSIHLIAVNAALKMVRPENLKAHLVELRYVSVLTKQKSGVYRYESVEKELTVSTDALVIPEGGLSYRLPTREPGDYALIVRNAQDKELTRIPFSVVGPGNLTRSLERNAELQVKLNKADFAAGEAIELEIRAPYTGAGLITLEQDKVYAAKWFLASTTNTVQTIEVPPDLEGNAYVNVSFVRSLDSAEIYMSPLSYGVVPFSVSRERRTNLITLSTPDLVRPGEVLTIRYATARPSKIVLYAVDEGILQVARYKTPKPLDYFFDKKALEVDTRQILDLLLPEFDLVQAQAAAGGDAEGALGANLNPFKRKRQKPVAYWSGIIDAGPEEREVSCELPDYFNGTVRVMAVAVAQDAIGVAEQTSLVRGHFVITPQVPTFAAPQDEFVVSVAIINAVEGSGEKAAITLELVTSEHLEVSGGTSRLLEISEGTEGTASYTLRAKSLLGSANLTFRASLHDKAAKYSVDLSVRPPNPYVTTVQTGYLKQKSAKIPVTRSLYAEHRTLEASASILPVGLGRGLITYLDNFPYGCTEQVLSKAFPALILHHRPEFGYTSGKVASILDESVSILRSRQNQEGAVGFWAANSRVSDFHVVYAAHFLTEAKEKGYPVPVDMLQKMLTYLFDLRKQVPASLEDARIHAYAIYLRTRNGLVTTNELDLLLKQLREKFPETWEDDLTAAHVAATFKLLHKDSEAEKLISTISLEPVIDADYDYYYDGLIRNSQVLYIVCTHFPDRGRALKGSDLEQVVKPIAQGIFNTTSAAYALLALDAYTDLIGEGEMQNIAIAELLPQGKRNEFTIPPGLFPAVAFSPAAEALQFSSNSDAPVFYQVTEAGFDKDLPMGELEKNLEVQREYRDGRKNAVTNAQVGDILTVHLKVRALESGSYSNIAVVDLLPGGFEVEQERGSERSSPGESPGNTSKGSQDIRWQPDYVDIREDRMVVFGTVSPKAAEYIYRIRAVNQGTYQLPPIFAESMYDRSMQAKGLGGTMVVEGVKR